MWKLMLLSLSLSRLCLAGPSAAEIIRKADEIRNPDLSFMMKAEVTSSDGSDPLLFEVSISGNDKTLIRTLAPKRDLGRDMLMLQENMWSFVPNLKRSVRVGLAQKLTGEAANGDISRMRWAQDYDAKIEKDEPSSWTLFLTARKKGLTYEKIRAVVEKKTFHPVSAEYLTAEAKVLKRAKFTDYRELAGKSRPSLIVIEDAIRTSKKSEIHIREIKVKTFPDSLFSLERFGAK